MKKIVLQALAQAAQQLHTDGDHMIIFTRDIERMDKMVEWLFDNTKYRFVILGTDTVYFEDNDDALLFRMTWG